MNAETLMTQEQKARAYDALVAQMNVLLELAPNEPPRMSKYLHETDAHEDMGRYDMARRIRNALAHAQLVADEPAFEEVDTKRFEVTE